MLISSKVVEPCSGVEALKSCSLEEEGRLWKVEVELVVPEVPPKADSMRSEASRPESMSMAPPEVELFLYEYSAAVEKRREQKLR